MYKYEKTQDIQKLIHSPTLNVSDFYMKPSLRCLNMWQ